MTTEGSIGVPSRSSRRPILFILPLILLSGPLHSQPAPESMRTNLTGMTNSVPESAANSTPRLVAGFWNRISSRFVEKAKSSTFSITGNKSLEIRSGSFTGDPAFKPPEAWVPYRRSETARILAAGSLFGMLNMNAELIQSSEGDSWGFDHDRYRTLINLKTPYFGMEFGDLVLNYPRTGFVLRNKSGTGVKGDFAFRPFDFMGFYVTSKGVPGRAEFTGDGSQGPYSLGAFTGFIVAESETVLVNGREMKNGTDYILDGYSGEIYFLLRPIGLQDRVEAVYEVAENLFGRKCFGGSLFLKFAEPNLFGIDFAMEQDDPERWRELSMEAGTNSLGVKPRRNLATAGYFDLRFFPGFRYWNAFGVKGEAAWSRLDPDISTPDSPKKDRFAFKGIGKASGKGYDAEFGGSFVEDDYLPVGNPEIRDDSRDYSAGLEFRPWTPLTLRSRIERLRDRDDLPDTPLLYDRSDLKNALSLKIRKDTVLNAERRDYYEKNDLPSSVGLDIVREENTLGIVRTFSNVGLEFKGLFNRFVQKRPEALFEERREMGGAAGIGLQNLPFLSLRWTGEALRNETLTAGIFYSYLSSVEAGWKPAFRKKGDTNMPAYGKILSVRVAGRYSYNALRRREFATNTNAPAGSEIRPSGGVWSGEAGLKFAPAERYRTEAEYRISLFTEKEEAGGGVDIYNQSLSGRLEARPLQSLDLDHQSRMEWAEEISRRLVRQWDLGMETGLRLDPWKTVRTRTVWRHEAKRVRPKLEPSREQNEKTHDLTSGVKVLPVSGLLIEGTGSFLRRERSGYFDVGVDDHLGIHNLTNAESGEERRKGRLALTRRIVKSFNAGTSLGVERYFLMDPWRIEQRRSYLPADTGVSAARLSETDYLEYLAGLRLDYKPLDWISSTLDYAYSVLQDRGGTMSQKNTHILKPAMDFLIFEAVRFRLDCQWDSSYYTEDAGRPSRFIANASAGFERGSAVRMALQGRYESSRLPDYEYYTASAMMNVAF